MWNWYILSAQTYVSLFSRGGESDNLPISRSGSSKQLEAIKQPTLAIVGEHDYITIWDLQKDLEMIKNQAINCQEFETFLLPGATHAYENREVQLSDKITSWLDKFTH
ncbi:MAG: hypothetical protein JWS12_320 [Candidatus Saccharibacteria bacterium]|nr:hypothetical protein [Candidatus Saccharibacteria bacterium]